MAEDSDRKMTVPQLLQAREDVRAQIERLNYRGYKGTMGGDPSAPLRAELDAILQEIEAELAEQGHTDA